MNKHGKKCQCRNCTSLRASVFRARTEDMKLPRFPATWNGKDLLVPVRAHYRRQRGYLNKDEALKWKVLEILRENYQRWLAAQGRK